MEETLKFEMPYVGGSIPKKNVCRALIVVLGMLMLWLENQMLRHHGLVTERRGNAGISRVYIGELCAGNIELYSELTKNIELPGYGIGRYHLELDIVKYEGAGRMTDKIDPVKASSVKAAGNTAAEGSPAYHSAANSGIAGNCPAVENPAEENSAEETVSEVMVTAYGNGGMPEITEYTFGAADFTAEALEIPKRPGKLFTGWYEDAEETVPFENSGEAGESLTVYAGWSEFPGFVCNDFGRIIACTGEEEAVSGGLLVLPPHESCVGVERGAFDGLEDRITDIYIPANITYIEPGAFDTLTSLMYIQADDRNPVYYSRKGILYDRNENVAAYPNGRNTSAFSGAADS